MKTIIARAFSIAALLITQAFGAVSVPPSDITPVTSGTVLGRSSAGSGRAEQLTAGDGITIANGQISAPGGGGGAPITATFVTQTPNASLTNEQALSLLGSGFMFSTTATGVITTVGFPLTATYGGTDNAFTAFTGPAGATKTFTLPNATSTILTTAAAVTVAQGGTGMQLYTIGDLIFANGGTSLNRLADVASGNVLLSGGVGVAPAYGKVGLTTHVSGTLPITSGGTGQTTYTNGQILIGNTTSSGLDKTTLTAGTGITIVNTPGTITINSTAGSGNVTGSSLTANAVTLGAGSNAIQVLASLGTTAHPLVSAGAGAPPAFGLLTVPGGGIGAATLTQNAVITGNGTGAVTSVSPGTGGNVLTSSGGAWVSAAATGGGNTSATTTMTTNNVAVGAGTTNVKTSPVTIDTTTGDITTAGNITVGNMTTTNLTISGTITGVIGVTNGGSGRATGTTAYSLIATGTTATGTQQTLANGGTTEVLVGGGASALPVWTVATGTGAPVRATSATLVTPVLGTPTSVTLTNATGLPITTGVAGLGTGVATFLATPSWSNFNSAVTGTAPFANTGSVTSSTLTMSTASLLGRTTVGTGAIEEIGLAASLAFSAPLTLAVADDGVTYAKMQNVSAQYRVLGRISASAGDTEELTPANVLTLAESGGTNILIATEVDTNAELRAITVGLGAAVVGGTFASPTTTDPLTLTANDSYGFVRFYGATGVINLPAGVAGMNGIIYNTGAFTITINPDGSEIVVRDGTAQSGGVSFTLSSGAGNYVSLLFDGTRWVTLGYKGTLAAGS